MITFQDDIKWNNICPEIVGNKNIKLLNIASIKNIKNNSLIFVNNLSDEIVNSLNSYSECLLILNEQDKDLSTALQDKHSIIYANNPRYKYAEILNVLFDFKTLRQQIFFDKNLGIYRGQNVIVDSSAFIEPNCVIFSNTVIGSNSYIMAGAKIGPNVKIGNNTIIRENSIIGGFGFGLARDENKRTIRIPHLGGVIIGDNIEIGALNTVCSGTIEPTVIEDYVKTDDHVHIAHNCHIEKEVIITACSEISGSVRIGSKTWLGPNCSIINGIYIGANCFIGIGAVVTKEVLDGITVAGNPARKISSSQ